MHKPSRDEFMAQVAQHEMTVHLDSGMHRHLTLKRPGSSNRHFHITTWPGYLTISGDMGCYVFARLPDMFEFFRDGKDINAGYWGEKLQATARHEGYFEFSREYYLRAVIMDFRSAYPVGTPERLRIWRDVRWELLDHADPQSVEEAVTRVHDYRDPNGESHFSEFWDHTLQDYSYHFIWCCRAVRWAIDQYDASKAKVAA